ncbi:uncharacterized protein BJ171DRAFT_578368 [Polychytrium aggregatum]|uniref:uncharacterized protein n=1 Tax=Polychytrium aggregatum TaxID=110093 RepID=UPI0022FE0B19|nr:uncharacterized protein BJ171DRAFT_578368 [Polychytrium aggregatum]KAI9207892.1 hypothetical protein BJ171DRAFT_578368 [Polychytrium aggregatum]
MNRPSSQCFPRNPPGKRVVLEPLPRVHLPEPTKPDLVNAETQASPAAEPAAAPSMGISFFPLGNLSNVPNPNALPVLPYYPVPSLAFAPTFFPMLPICAPSLQPELSQTLSSTSLIHGRGQDESHRREEKERQWRLRRHSAAIVLQKYIRRWLVKRDFIDTKLNPIARERNPLQYFVERLIDQVLKSEVIPDIIVEVSEESYAPYPYIAQVFRTKAFRCLYIKYHIIEEALCDEIPLIVSEAIEELAAEYVPEPPLPLAILESIVDPVVREECCEVVRELVKTIVNEHILQEASERIFSHVLNEVYNDMEIAQSVLSEEISISIFFEMVDEEIQRSTRRIALDLQNELPVKFYIRRPHRPKSLQVNTAMGFLLGQMSLRYALARLVQGQSSSHSEIVETQTLCSQEADRIILRRLLRGLIDGSHS